MRRKICKVYIKLGLIILLIVCSLYFLFIYGFSLHKSEYRLPTSFSLTASDKKEIIALLASAENETEIIKECNEYACKKLSFHRRNNLKNGEANCVGYAQYSAALLNYAFLNKGLHSKARPVVGQVHWYGINLHPIVVTVLPKNLKPFFKDHDFVEIKKENGETVFIDTSLQDLLGKSDIQKAPPQ